MTKVTVQSIAKKIKGFTISSNKLFLFVFLSCFFIYGYNKILFYRPVGVHQWRNSISAAFALNYYHDGNFFKTRTNALLADNRTSDITIVEFPIVYYFVSLLYRIFGPHELLFRLVNVLIGFLGLFYLFKTSLLFVKDKLYAIAVPLFIFTSPIYVFYTNNFIPDATCLSIAFIGVYYFFEFYFLRKKKCWYYSMFFLLLAGLVKTPALIFFFTVGIVGIIDLMHGYTGKQPKIYPSWPIFIMSCFIFFAVLIAWYVYAKIYSDAHGGSVSPVELRPIWILNSTDIKETWEKMAHRFRQGDYHSSLFLIISGVALCTNLILNNRYSRLLNLFTLFTFLGAIGFTVVFFRSMYHHDYYQIGNLIFIPFLYLNVFIMLKNRYPKVFYSAISKLILIAALVLLVNDCRINMTNRYSTENFLYYWSNKNIKMYGELGSYLRQLGIKRSDIVYCTPDNSINISLYLMDQKGFTDYGSQHLTPKERFELLKDRGMQYVIIGDRKYAKDIEAIEKFFGEKIGQFGTTEIFQIPD